MARFRSIPEIPGLVTSYSMLGAQRIDGKKVEIRVWAPRARRLRAVLADSSEVAVMTGAAGLFKAVVPASSGSGYLLALDDHKPVPDPVSRFLPEGVHGPTEVMDPDAWEWHDSGWRGLPRTEYIIYELHIGTFTPAGTFDATVDKLPYLKSLGITVIELMPVSAFPGERNWGYDGVSLYAVQAGYGGPAGLKRLVDAAHQAGLAVILDVVYNHFGNEGNYLRLFGPYFTDRYRTPWGDAVNYDQPGCEHVRRFIVENALYWIREYHLDGLRLDAVQTIHDDSPRHIVAEIRDEVEALAHNLGREVCMIAETDENDARYTRPGSGGYGIDAVWSDDFHHAFHAFLTGENKGYYQDFGSPKQIARALNEGFVFQGEHFGFWNGPRGGSAAEMTLPEHVICLQNHDQVGNRATGERLNHLVPPARLYAPAAFLLLAPHTPLIFMGQEYDEPAPFQFFTSYSDPALQEAVRKGRREEFKDFGWEEVPDPQDPATFRRSKLNWDLAMDAHNPMAEWYRSLIALRKRLVVPGSRTCRAEWHADGVLTMQVPAEGPRLFVAATLEPSAAQPSLEKYLPLGGDWGQALSREAGGFAVEVWERST
ncbi:MAG: malto-oligosyltrehalose trehalohydrolase [Acidobacteria bacterium]|nr:malto-oligosyltrehalose trehalohydrolase [Acidobacteriota bacterium]